MIYYIVRIERNGDETVISSWDNPEAATTHVEGYRNAALAVGSEELEYRIDTVPSNEEIRAANAAIPADPNKHTAKDKLDLNRIYGRNKMDHEEQHYAYRDTDSMRTKDFTLTELFGWYEGNKSNGPFLVCGECGSAVVIESRDVHRQWHNKLLP